MTFDWWRDQLRVPKQADIILTGSFRIDGDRAPAQERVILCAPGIWSIWKTLSRPGPINWRRMKRELRKSWKATRRDGINRDVGAQLWRNRP